MRPQTQCLRSALDIGTIRTLPDSNRQEHFLFLSPDARNGEPERSLLRPCINACYNPSQPRDQVWACSSQCQPKRHNGWGTSLVLFQASNSPKTAPPSSWIRGPQQTPSPSILPITHRKDTGTHHTTSLSNRSLRSLTFAAVLQLQLRLFRFAVHSRREICRNFAFHWRKKGT